MLVELYGVSGTICTILAGQRRPITSRLGGLGNDLVAKCALHSGTPKGSMRTWSEGRSMLMWKVCSSQTSERKQDITAF